MPKRPANRLERWEVALVKAMLAKELVPQDILAYFTRPTRSINHARISEIRDEAKHKLVKTASEDELDAFLQAWPNVDETTGLHYQGDELLIKAREAMIAAVHTFNSAGLYFRAELFVVTSIIAWTYLMHAYFRKEGVDYRYKKNGVVEITPSGAPRHWDLSKCLSTGHCPLELGVVNNLKFLLEIRHEIEHRSTSRIDDALSAKLQACCINFNDAIRELFGKQYALEKRLPIALQFVTFDGAQRGALLGADMPANIEVALDNFHDQLSEEEQKDQRFGYRVAFVPKVSSKASRSDLAVEFVKAGSLEAEAVERVLLKEVERQKYTSTQIVNKLADAGQTIFNMHDHSLLARQLNARDPSKGYGVKVANSWFWYPSWFDKILEKLEEGWTRNTKA